MNVDPTLIWLVRVALALLFAHAALHKSRDLAGFERVFADYRLVPESWAPLLARTTLLAEASLALGLLISGFAATVGQPVAAPTQAVVAGTIALLSLYSVAISVNLARGRRDIDCGCADPAARSPQIAPWLLARNALLISAAGLLLWPTSTRPLHWIDAISLVGGLVPLALVWNTIHGLAAVPTLSLARTSS